MFVVVLVVVDLMSTFQQPTTYTCNRPNEKNEDRFSEEQMQIAGTEFTVLGIYDGELLRSKDVVLTEIY